MRSSRLGRRSSTVGDEIFLSSDEIQPVGDEIYSTVGDKIYLSSDKIQPVGDEI